MVAFRSFLIAITFVTTLTPPASAQGGPQADQFQTQLEAEAQQGDLDSQNLLGIYLRGAKHDAVAGHAWFLKAAEQGHGRAAENAGLDYSMGQGVPRNDRLAVFWLQKAADHQLASAQVELAQILLRGGEGVPKDRSKAIALLTAAARQGNNDAIATLATNGVPVVVQSNATPHADPSAQIRQVMQAESNRAGSMAAAARAQAQQQSEDQHWCTQTGSNTTWRVPC
ncbi:tetratricopeptide repeat protein [Burkholderia gladioli]|uniref:tetratricopeptide repeat protein n=1 Tax=Burkholderia gladioli TaxID=28095 RepID=UPI001642209D|nr:tetratricopeptide repeat protein [Burkholderia gladioli]